MQVVKFNKKIYNNEAIKQAIDEFENLADFDMKNTNNYFEVKIDKVDNEVKDILLDEFANYVLGLLS
jgi:hypothetical protein